MGTHDDISSSKIDRTELMQRADGDVRRHFSQPQKIFVFTFIWFSSPKRKVSRQKKLMKKFLTDIERRIDQCPQWTYVPRCSCRLSICQQNNYRTREEEEEESRADNPIDGDEDICSSFYSKSIDEQKFFTCRTKKIFSVAFRDIICWWMKVVSGRGWAKSVEDDRILEDRAI